MNCGLCLRGGLVALGFALAGCSLGGAEPPNVDLAKGAVRAYVASGAYAAEVAAVAARAEAWLAERAGRRASGERLALVLDIDETLLSNWEFMSREDLGGSDDAWDRWLAAGTARPLAPMLRVYRRARELNITVCFITSREEHLRAATERNLQAVGCAEYLALRMKPDGWHGPMASFKSAERRKIGEAGYTVVATIGDQASDLEGGAAERTFKLPGPFYLVP